MIGENLGLVHKYVFQHAVVLNFSVTVKFYCRMLTLSCPRGSPLMSKIVWR